MNGGSGQLAGPAAGGDLPSLASLQAALPVPMRQPRFAAASLPPRFASAIRHGGPGQEIDLSPLPARMRQETAWCLFRIIEIGGTVAVPAVNMLARRLGEAIADAGRTAAGRCRPRCWTSRSRTGPGRSRTRCTAVPASFQPRRRHGTWAACWPA